MDSRSVGDEGVIILEVLITSIVVGIAIVGIALMFSYGHAFILAAGDDRVAIYLAKQKIEDLRELSISCIPTGGPGTLDAPIGPNAGCSATAKRVYNESQVAGAPRYRRTTVVACADPNNFDQNAPCSASAARRIAVTVAGPMAQGRPITVESVLAVH